MRRKELELTDKDEIISIVKRAKVCRIGLSHDNIPYIVPVNFGFEENKIYFHSAKKGKKIDILKKNNNVCVEIDLDYKLKEGDDPCSYGTNYYSVMRSGKAEFIEDIEEKKYALNIIMDHYTSNKNYEFNDRMIKRLALIKINIDELTGKKSGYGA